MLDASVLRKWVFVGCGQERGCPRLWRRQAPVVPRQRCPRVPGWHVSYLELAAQHSRAAAAARSSACKLQSWSFAGQLRDVAGSAVSADCRGSLISSICADNLEAATLDLACLSAGDCTDVFVSCLCSLAGDYGFDPLGLASDPATLRW